MQPYQHISTNLKKNVFTIQLSRPKANAFNTLMAFELQDALKVAQKDPQTRCIILKGAGKLFSAGQDLSALADENIQSIRAHIRRTYNPIILQIREIAKPVIGAINGAASGAGLGIALACDLRIASEKAKFVAGFSGVGLAPDSGVSLLLPLLIGLGRAAEFTFTNKPIQAEQALVWGLVNRVVPPSALDEEAQKWGEQLAQGPVNTFGLTKRAFNHACLPNLKSVLMYETELQEVAGRSAEHQEGLRAFLEKRPPQFL